MKARISGRCTSQLLLVGFLFAVAGVVPDVKAATEKPRKSVYDIPEAKETASHKDGDTLTEAENSANTVSGGLTGSDWKSIRQEYERHRHAAVAVDGEFSARNPGQQWLTHFNRRGFAVEPDGASWRWGLELQSYGFPGYERAVSGRAKMTAQNDRVTYDWNQELQEWFINDRNGLEHGFTLFSRPPGAGDQLELRMAVRGGLRAQGHADGQGVSFLNEQGHAVVNYTGLKVWDADHRELPARIDAADSELRLTVDERDARYPLTVDPVAQQAYLKASNTDAGDLFGESLAVSGDTVVIGARYEDSNATGINGNQTDNSATHAGAAYVFVRDGGGIWTQQAYLKASNTEANEEFGTSVAVSGDTVVVGAVIEDSNATGVDGNQADNSAFASGAAYVFIRDGGGVWTQQAYLKASNTEANDEFGISVAVSGDTVVVGAYLEDGNGTGVNGNQTNNSAGNSGAAYVFVRDGGGIWTQQAYLKASNTDGALEAGLPGDQFGISVGVSGDTVVVGADLEDSTATGVNGDQADNSAFNSGAAYVFVRDGGGIWTQQAYLKASNTGVIDQFALSMAIDSNTVVVGALAEDSNATGVNGDQTDNSAGNAGAAYVFVRDGGGVWTQQAYLKASNTDPQDLFGSSVAVSGDTAVVGAQLEASNATGVNGNQTDNSFSSSGAAYVFARDGGGIWSQKAYLKASNTDPQDRFGISVGASGDSVVVGANLERSIATGVNGNQADNSANGSGAAYIYYPSLCCNGLVDVGEECDDGGSADGDGCSATCMVESGYTCDASEPSVCTDVNECTLGTDNCDVNAMCSNTPGGFTCTCNAGYSGDGVTCVDENECVLGTHNCDANATCSNLPGSYECICNEGYEGDGFTCTDINECAEGLADCDVNAMCSNTPGGFTCTCNAGYSGDGVTCVDENECVLGTDNCDVNATCLNLPGSYECICKGGYEGDGFTCTDVNECAEGLDDCDVNATCINTLGSFDCVYATLAAGDDTCAGGSNDGGSCSTDVNCPGGVCGLKSRYISVTPAVATVAGGNLLSIQVTVLNVEDGLGQDAREGEVWWAGVSAVTDNTPNGTLNGAQLLCELSPSNAQAWPVGVLHLFGAPIVPGSSYEVRMCDAAGVICFDPFVVATGKWGDIVPEFGGASQPNFADITAVVDKFKASAVAPDITRTDLGSAGSEVLDFAANFADISADVDAFKGLSYPYTIPACP